MRKGLLVVIDGIDGSGKTTQVNLLSEYLNSKNIAHEVISFPRYEDNLYGKLIRRYLDGEFGSIGEVSPYLMALAYAGDRVLAKSLIESWLQSGKIVIANRYVSSSKAHLGANLLQDQREKFFRWLYELEYETNGIPKEDLTILLSVDPDVGQKNVQGTDIHENNLKHLEQAGKIYLELSHPKDGPPLAEKAGQNWKVIDCMEGEKMKDKDSIHKLLVELLSTYLVT